MPDMDTAAFAKWLTGIGRLDGPQRDRAVRELALAAAADAIADPDPALDDARPGGVGEVSNGWVAQASQADCAGQ